LILPTPVRPPNSIPLPAAPRLLPKPGGGFSEEHDLRPYRLGDPFNTMHWKISAKLDSLIVREPLAPPPHNRLISLTVWSEPNERDLILGRLRWSSAYLLERGFPHYVRLGERGSVVEIAQPEDLIAFLHWSLIEKNTGEGMIGETVAVMVGARLRSRKQLTTAVPSTHFSWILKIDARVTQ